jgi:hypothetical protein
MRWLFCSDVLGWAARRVYTVIDGSIPAFSYNSSAILIRSRYNDAPCLRVNLACLASSNQLDGTDFALFWAGRLAETNAGQTTERLAVFVEMERRDDGGGTLGAVSLRRNLHSYRKITRTSDGLFHSPAPLPGRQVLAARRTTGTYGVVVVDPTTGRITGIYDAPAFHDIQPKAIAPRPEPDWRSSVVDESDPTGKFYCLSVYNNDLRDPDWMRPGIAERLRVVEANILVRLRLLGEFNLSRMVRLHPDRKHATRFQVLMGRYGPTFVHLGSNKNGTERVWLPRRWRADAGNRFAQAWASGHPTDSSSRTKAKLSGTWNPSSRENGTSDATTPRLALATCAPGQPRTSLLVWSITEEARRALGMLPKSANSADATSRFGGATRKSEEPSSNG